MSDGGAQVIVAAGQGVVQLAKFSVGRVVLWFIAAWLTLSAVTAHSEARLYFFLAVAIAVVALIGHFIAERQRRAERAALRTTLVLMGVVLVSLVGGLWLAFRRKATPPSPPPSEAEIDELLR
jgi:steroid 5-alpha reductase family enzyme